MSIEIYGRPMCFTCEAAINIVESNGASYNYYNIEQMSSEDLQYLMSRIPKEVRNVPIIISDGRVLGDIHELKQSFESKRSTTEVVDIR